MNTQFEATTTPTEDKALYSFYSLIFRQKYIRRWGLMHSIVPESLSEHTTEATVLAHALALIGNRFYGKQYDPGKIALLALYHDAPEVYTGDLPTPIKYFDAQSRESYAAIEEHAVQALLRKLPPELRSDYAELFSGGTPEEHRLVKAADKLCAYIKCIEENKCGNAEFLPAARSTKKALDQMDCPELHYFMEHCLPPFASAIDEF